MSKFNIILLICFSLNMNCLEAHDKTSFKIQSAKTVTKTNIAKRDAFIKQFWL